MGAQLQSDERELYRRHNDKLVAVLRGSFRLDEHEAGDVAQRAWLLFLEKQPRRENVFGWLYTTAKHEAFARWRRLRREPPVEQADEADDETDLAAGLDRAELRKQLAEAFAGRLTDNQRGAVWLWAQGYSYREIAGELGKTYTWANRHITEGLRAFREELGWEPSTVERLRQQAVQRTSATEGVIGSDTDQRR